MFKNENHITSFDKKAILLERWKEYKEEENKISSYEKITNKAVYTNKDIKSKKPTNTFASIKQALEIVGQQIPVQHPIISSSYAWPVV